MLSRLSYHNFRPYSSLRPFYFLSHPSDVSGVVWEVMIRFKEVFGYLLPLVSVRVEAHK